MLTHHCTIIGRTGGTAPQLRAAAAPHELTSLPTPRSAALECANHEVGFGEQVNVGDTLGFGGRLGQSEDGAYAHGKRGNGGEDDLELHGWAGEEAFFWGILIGLYR